MTAMRLILLALASAALISCGNGDEDEERNPLAKKVWESLTSSQEDAPPPPPTSVIKAGLTPEILAQIDGPVMIAQIPSRNAVALLTRAGSNQGVDTFLSRDAVSISLRDGMIVATRGLGFDLMVADVTGPLSGVAGTIQRTNRVHSYLDGDNLLIEQSFTCDFVATGDQSVTESCTSGATTFENSYILDNKGNIRASKQWITTQIGEIGFELID